jgi:hypothetical protein
MHREGIGPFENGLKSIRRSLRRRNFGMLWGKLLRKGEILHVTNQVDTTHVFPNQPHAGVQDRSYRFPK